MSTKAIHEEIEDYAKTRILENLNYDEDYLNNEVSDIHNQLFNEDYYIIGRYEARQWLNELDGGAFEGIGLVVDYELQNFGESSTEVHEPEKVANMVAYIIGEEILESVIEEIQEEQEDKSEEANEELSEHHKDYKASKGYNTNTGRL